MYVKAGVNKEPFTCKNHHRQFQNQDKQVFFLVIDSFTLVADTINYSTGDALDNSLKKYLVFFLFFGIFLWFEVDDTHFHH